MIAEFCEQRYRSLPIRHSVKRRLISRDEVGRFLKKKFDEDEGVDQAAGEVGALRY